MIKNSQGFLVVALVLAGACSTPGGNPPAHSGSYAEAHAAAVSAIDISVARGHAWSTSDALLKKAVEAAADGDEDLAIQLADSARVQAELATRQADIEEKIWSERVLSNQKSGNPE